MVILWVSINANRVTHDPMLNKTSILVSAQNELRALRDDGSVDRQRSERGRLQERGRQTGSSLGSENPLL